MLTSLGALAGAAAFSAMPRLAGAQGTPVAATDSFPVTIPHVYGETVIPKAPERIVTWGWSTDDAILALGIVPVAMSRNDYAGDVDGIHPWTRAALGDRATPVMLDVVEVPFEAIAAVQPDLILGIYSGITQEEYDLLSQIAPTVAYPEVAWGTAWQDVQRIAGQAVGRSADAEKLVADTEALIAAQTEQYPQIAGKTFVYGNMGLENNFYIYTETDARSRFLSAIGLEPAEFVKNLKPEEGESTFYVPISYEFADTIACDILIFWFDSQEAYDAAAQSQAYQAIPAVARGSVAPIIGKQLVMASSAFSVLSIPYMLDAYIPTLAAAADKV